MADSTEDEPAQMMAKQYHLIDEDQSPHQIQGSDLI